NPSKQKLRSSVLGMGSLSVDVVDLEIVFDPFGVHGAALYAHSTTIGSFFTVTLPRPVLSKRLPWRRTASDTRYFAMSSVTGVGLDPIAAKACAILSLGLPRFFLTVPAGIKNSLCWNIQSRPFTNNI